MRCASGIQDVAIGPVNQPPSFYYEAGLGGEIELAAGSALTNAPAADIADVSYTVTYGLRY